MTRISEGFSTGRYVEKVVNGTVQWVRNQVALQAEIVELFDQMGGLPKKRIIMTLSTTQAAVEQALAALLRDGAIERYRAKSIRGRMDEHWCIAGMAPVPPLAANGSRYNAIAILTAMQQHAATLHKGVQR
jgi:predicted ArsR family transcriptional regulator